MSRPPSTANRARRRSGVPLLVLGALITSSPTVAATPDARAADSLLSQGKAATSSSHEGEAFTAAAAFDGDPGTRWASQWRDGEWIQVDLGAVRSLSRVLLTWEAAYGRSYRIQASDHGTDWRTLTSVTAGDGGTDELSVSGSGRYVRMQGGARSGGYGYSLWSHPATLMWNVGNESVLGLHNCYSGAELEAQRNAYTTFVNDVAKRIHSVDPDHPVTSTDAWTGAWPYYKRDAPDLERRRAPPTRRPGHLR